MQEQIEQLSYYEKIKSDYGEALIIISKLKEERAEPSLQHQNVEE